MKEFPKNDECDCGFCRDRREIDREIARLKRQRDQIECAREVGARIARGLVEGFRSV